MTLSKINKEQSTDHKQILCFLRTSTIVGKSTVQNEQK